MKRIYVVFLLALVTFNYSNAQIKILFDATKAETAANADWVIDEDLYNLDWNPGPIIQSSGTWEGNAQRIPTPAQSGITSSTAQTYWVGGISAWGVDMVKQGYYVETLPYNGTITYGNTGNAQDLSNYKVFCVVEPNIKFSAAEDTAIIKFVKNGGGLFVVSDHDGSDRNNDGWDSPHIWNMALDTNSFNPFGIHFDYTTFSQTSTNLLSSSTDPLLHGVKGNVTEVQWSGGTSMTLNKTSNPSVKGVAFKSGASTTGTTNVLVAYGTYGAGRFVAFGDSSPFDDGSGDLNDVLYTGFTGDAAGNHEPLIVNATIWLAGGTTSIPEVNGSNSILLNQLTYPGETKFVVSSSENLGNSEFCVYNMLGKLVMKFSNPASSDIVINNEKIGNGIYIYKLIVNGNAVKTGKFTIL